MEYFKPKCYKIIFFHTFPQIGEKMFIKFCDKKFV